MTFPDQRQQTIDREWKLHEARSARLIEFYGLHGEARQPERPKKEAPCETHEEWLARRDSIHEQEELAFRANGGQS